MTIFLLVFVFYIAALVLGVIISITAPIYIGFNYGVLWGLLAAYVLWPFTFTVNLSRQ